LIDCNSSSSIGSSSSSSACAVMVWLKCIVAPPVAACECQRRTPPRPPMRLLPRDYCSTPFSIAFRALRLPQCDRFCSRINELGCFGCRS
jgi:hypothetical protein